MIDNKKMIRTDNKKVYLEIGWKTIGRKDESRLHAHLYCLLGDMTPPLSLLFLVRFSLSLFFFVKCKIQLHHDWKPKRCKIKNYVLSPSQSKPLCHDAISNISFPSVVQWCFQWWESFCYKDNTEGHPSDSAKKKKKSNFQI